MILQYESHLVAKVALKHFWSHRIVWRDQRKEDGGLVLSKIWFFNEQQPTTTVVGNNKWYIEQMNRAALIFSIDKLQNIKRYVYSYVYSRIQMKCERTYMKIRTVSHISSFFPPSSSSKHHLHHHCEIYELSLLLKEYFLKMDHFAEFLPVHCHNT